MLSVILVSVLVMASTATPLSKGNSDNSLRLPPVVFVPGDGGNQMEAKLNRSSSVHYICDKTSDDYYNIWLNLEELVPVIIDCWVDNIKLTYDNVSRTTSNTDGVDIRVPLGFGDPFPVELLDPSEVYFPDVISPGSYFRSIGNTLVDNLGYVRNVSLRGAPYDFRKGPNENKEWFGMTKKLVEDTYFLNNNTRVVLMGHSMGGPMSLRFLQLMSPEWKAKYVRGLISLNAVWAGTVKTVKVFYMGDDLNVFVLPEAILHILQKTMPSIAWLLPSPHFWKPDEVLVQTSTRQYTMSQLEQFFTDMNYPTAWEMRKDQLQYIDFSAPGVEVYCFHGNGVGTVEQLVFGEGLFPNGKPDFKEGDGDGTVNIRSLQACTEWSKLQKQPIHHTVFPGIEHSKILRDDKVLAEIQQALKDMAEPEYRGHANRE